CCGDDSLGVALRENSSMPGLIFNNNAPSILLEGVLFFVYYIKVGKFYVFTHFITMITFC
ncbi:MAG: hypothetical protein LW859_29305, partial [Anabaena sp. 49633_E8]|nr:hypothetical protein [Anabaena sp. 49633_E8]